MKIEDKKKLLDFYYTKSEAEKVMNDLKKKYGKKLDFRSEYHFSKGMWVIYDKNNLKKVL